MQSLPLPRECPTEAANLSELLKLTPEEEANLYSHSFLFRDDPAQNEMGLGDANIYLYARSAYWTPEEIAALSLGKSPTVMAWPQSSHLVTLAKYPLCRHYLERVELVKRAVDADQLFEMTPPSFALAWLERTQIPYPQILRLEVERLGYQIADWKTEHDRMANRVHELTKTFELASKQYSDDLNAWKADSQTHKEWQDEACKLLVEQDNTIALSNAEIDKLHGEIKTLKSSLESKSLAGATKRASILKMLLGMALEQYGYTPEDSRSTVTATICDDLDSNGLSLDLKTIRKILKEAVDYHWERERE